MKFEIPPLPYAKDALAPYISERTVDIHYEKHHRGYLDKLEAAIGGSPLARRSLEEIILDCDDAAVFNLAAQVWNHTFYWSSLAPEAIVGTAGPAGPLGIGEELHDAIGRDFGDLPALRRELAAAANGEFGSGWAWLLADPAGRLSVKSSSDADNPPSSRMSALITIDVWEHAYYLDYQNDRGKYVESVVDRLLNWPFIEENYAASCRAAATALHQNELPPNAGF